MFLSVIVFENNEWDLLYALNEKNIFEMENVTAYRLSIEFDALLYNAPYGWANFTCKSPTIHTIFSLSNNSQLLIRCVESFE